VLVILHKKTLPVAKVTEREVEKFRSLLYNLATCYNLMSEYDSLKFLPRNVDTCFFQQKALSVALSFLFATRM